MKDLALETMTHLNDVVERELTELWLRPGERLVLTTAPIMGHVGVQLPGERLVPYTPSRPMPAVNNGPARWPLPNETFLNEDWPDDPTLCYWVHARGLQQQAVRYADYFAATFGTARLTLTDQRLAIVTPTKFLVDPPEPARPLTTFEETGTHVVRGFSAAVSGPSVPPRPLLRVDFTDGSTLFTKDLLASVKVGTPRH
jgi:hypothetical protein